MITKRDLRQSRLFDEVVEILHPKVRARFDADWPGILRRSILPLMPVEEVGKGFSSDFGRPTKEHYSICGLILLKGYFGWTTKVAVDRYLCDLKVQYALCLQPTGLELGSRTLERYLKIFVENKIAADLMQTVTIALIKELGLESSKQRLDSTHVFSNMADWGRATLMFQVTRRFLVQVKRHEAVLYTELDETVRQRYDGNSNWIFGETKITNTVVNGKQSTNREQIGWDMLRLIERFGKHPKLAGMNTFKDLVRVFGEQCEIDNGKVKIREHQPGNSLRNPSDPDATLDGHKGNGYQVQVAETCHPDNVVQLVTAVLPQTACVSDAGAVEPMLEIMEKVGAKPDMILADTTYGTDDNVTAAAAQDVELVAPTGSQPIKKMALEKFEFDEHRRIVGCPNGIKPLTKKYVDGKGRINFAVKDCENCPLRAKCRATRQGNYFVITYDAKDLRLMERRLREMTAAFRDIYRPRGGIEGLFGRLKLWTGLGKLLVRGEKAVFHAIYMIMAMHNIMQAVRFYQIKARQDRKNVVSAGFGPLIIHAKAMPTASDCFEHCDWPSIGSSRAA